MVGKLIVFKCYKWRKADEVRKPIGLRSIKGPVELSERLGATWEENEDEEDEDACLEWAGRAGNANLND